MIVADTSVWIEFLRGRRKDVGEHLKVLLDEDQVCLPVPVRLEILAGATRTTLPRLRRLLSALPALYPDDETWRILEGWVEEAVAAAERFGIGDLLIAALARQGQARVWSLDADFSRMARLGWIHLHDPREPREAPPRS